MIDAASGRSPGFVQLPPPLDVAPAADTRGRLVFQPAGQDDLFVLDMPEGRCLQVFPLGHAPGSISVPPLVLGDLLVVAVNDTARDSLLRVFVLRAADADALRPPLRLAQTIRLEGHVDTAPAIEGDSPGFVGRNLGQSPAAGQRLLVTTDAGVVRLFQRTEAGAKPPLRELAAARLDCPPGTACFPLLQPRACFVGGTRLARFDFRPVAKDRPKNGPVPNLVSVGEPERDSPIFVGRKLGQSPECDDAPQTFRGPIQALGGTLFLARNIGAAPGMVVSAVGPGRAKPYWQTCLAPPLAAEPIVDRRGGRLTLVTAAGGILQCRPAAADQPLAIEPAVPPGGVGQPVTAVAGLPDGTLALLCGGRCDELAVFDPRLGPAERLRSWLLPGPLSCPPIAWAGGLLAPAAAGQVFLWDPHSGQPALAAFQPRLRPGQRAGWRQPAAAEAAEPNQKDPAAVVIADGYKRLYRLNVVNEPAVHLEAVAEAELSDTIVSPLAVVGQTVCGVDATGKVNFFRLPGLARSAQHESIGQAVWGPRRVGNRVMLATADGQLTALPTPAR